MADGWLSSLLGIHRLKKSDNTVLPQRSTLKVIGATLTDDPTNKQSVLDISAGVNGTITVRKNSGSDVGTRGRLNLIEGSGVTLTVADDGTDSEVDVTIAATGATPTLQQAYTAGGTIDANVASGTNNLRVRAADLLTDVLLLFRRKVTSEQTILKAPDAISAGIAGTDLVLSSGAGKAATGSSDATDSGAVYISPNAPGTSVNGAAGSGGPINITGIAGANASGTGEAGTGSSVNISSGAGGNASDAGVNGGDSGDINIDVQNPGTSPGGEPKAGFAGVVNVGFAKARGAVLGYLGILLGVKVAGATIWSGSPAPAGTYTGNPGDYYFRQSTTSTSGLYQHRGTSANNTSWARVLDSTGGTLTGPLLTTQTNVAFSTTPSFDVAANDDFALGTLTNNIAITLANPAVGQSGTISFLQDGTGSRRITGITVSGFTVRCLNAGGFVNTSEFKAAGARSVLFYKMVTINSVNLCLIQIAGDGAVSPDFS